MPAPNPQARNIATTPSMVRPRKVDVVVLEDFRISCEEPEALVRGQCDLSLAWENAISTHLGLLALVVPAVLHPHPVGARESLVWLSVNKRLVVTTEHHADETAGFGDPDLLLVGYENERVELLVRGSLRNRRDALEPGRHRIKPELSTHTQIPQTLCLDFPLIIGLGSNATGRQAGDQLHEMREDSDLTSGLQCIVDLCHLADMRDIERGLVPLATHLYLHRWYAAEPDCICKQLFGLPLTELCTFCFVHSCVQCPDYSGSVTGKHCLEIAKMSRFRYTNPEIN
jgi:hypothetical protein